MIKTDFISPVLTPNRLSLGVNFHKTEMQLNFLWMHCDY